MSKFLLNVLFASISAILLIVGGTFVVYPAITGLSGLAVAQSATRWNNVKDAALGDNLTNGILAMSLYMYDGTNFDRLRGDITNGIDVDVTRLGGTVADNTSNPSLKLPVLPCRANAAVQTWTEGNVVPCSTDLSGRQRILASQGPTDGSGVALWNTAITQGLSLFNSQTTSAANTAVVVTIAAAANVRAQLYSLEAQCSAGTGTITVADGGTTIFTSMGANVPAAPATYRREWPVAVSGSTNTAMTITLSTCGAGNTGTLHVHASRW